MIALMTTPRRRVAELPEWLEKLLFHPGRVLRHLLQLFVEFLGSLVPLAVTLLVAVVLLLLVRTGWRWWREREMGANARRIRIHPPPEVEPGRAEVLWTGLHALIRPWWRRLIYGQPHVAWEVSAQGDEAEVSIWVPKTVPPGLVERAVEVGWPGARAEETPEDPVAELRRGSNGRIEACELHLAEPEWLPVGGEPKDNPLELALAAAGGLGSTERAMIQVLAQPATSRARHRLVRAAQVLRAGGKPGRWAWRVGRGRSVQRPGADPRLEADVRSIMAKAASPSWHCTVRVAVQSSGRRESRGRIHGLAGAFAMFEGRNGFRRRRIRGGLRALRGRRLNRSYLLSVPELARVASLPGTGTLAGFEASGARTAPPPRALPDTGRVLGEADHPSAMRPVALGVEDARHHVHVIGETGTGKSTLLANLVLQDAAAGRSAVVIDPKGDLVEAVLERLPDGAEDRACVIDPDDREWAVGLNVLAGDDADLVVDHVVAVFKRIYEPWWGPRTDDIMRAACLTLTQVPGTTLAEVPMLLTSYVWRHAIRERLNDVVGVSAFWDLYERMQEQQRSQHIAPLMNKLRAFLLRGPVRAIVGQPHPELEIADFLDSGGLLLVRIPKGTLGEETSRLLGAFVIARVWQACMRRAGRPESQRTDTALYVDEVHNYLVLPRSFEDLLAEARGYRLSLVLAHQHLGQLPREVRDALGANARTKVVFTCSPEDAFHLQRHFAPRLTDFDLSHLAAFQAACRPSVGGGQGAGFTFRTAPLSDGSKARARAVRTASKRFARRRTEVEEEIANRQVRPELRLLPKGSDAKSPSRGRSVGRSEGPSVDRPRAAHPEERGAAGGRPQ
ncbi:MAG: type IV secretion system DNA-binding domain-containing protein [Actinomycetota bacterium]